MKHLFKSLAAFQQEVPVIHKATQGYGYTYADLPKILEVINPLLKKHGLGFTQLINGTQIATCLFHVESAESIESKIDIPQGVILKGMNEFQVLGSAITYLRRYALSSILGIVSDKDTDASGEQVKNEPKKSTIDNARFQKAIDAISKGEYTVEELTTKFSLTEAQLKLIKV
jgi:threonine dehydrogenase-like Zn-dependent dehydrogenase